MTGTTATGSDPHDIDEPRRFMVDCADSDEVDALIAHHFPQLNSKRALRDTSYFEYFWSVVDAADDRTQPFIHKLSEVAQRAHAYRKRSDEAGRKQSRRLGYDTSASPDSKLSFWTASGDGPERSLERLAKAGVITYSIEGDRLAVTLAPMGVAYEQGIPGWRDEDFPEFEGVE